MGGAHAATREREAMWGVGPLRWPHLPQDIVPFGLVPPLAHGEVATQEQGEDRQDQQDHGQLDERETTLPADQRPPTPSQHGCSPRPAYQKFGNVSNSLTVAKLRQRYT